MYAAEVDGKQLNFAVSGMLWKRSLVMRDDETESLWSHILGKCMDGELKGTVLKIHPSYLTDWKSWKEMYPLTTAVVMTKTHKDFQSGMYKDVEKFLVGISDGQSSRAWKFDLLAKSPVVNDYWNEQPVVVNLDTPSYSSTVFSRKVAGKVYTFERNDESIVDTETQSTWNLQTGVAIDGALAGTQLEQLQSVPSFTKTWKEFHPESSYWDPANPIAGPETSIEETQTESKPESSNKDDDEKKSNSNYWIVILAIGIPALIGFLVYFKVMK